MQKALKSLARDLVFYVFFFLAALPLALMAMLIGSENEWILPGVVYVALCGLLGMVVGMFSAKFQKTGWFAVGAFVASVAGGLLYFSDIHPLQAVVLMLVGGGFSAMTLRIPRKGDESLINLRNSLLGLILFALAWVALSMAEFSGNPYAGGYRTLLEWSALIYLLMTAVGLNYSAVSVGANFRQTGVRMPKGVRRGNWVLVGGFIALVVAFLSIPGIQNAMAWTARQIIGVIGAILTFIRGQQAIPSPVSPSATPPASGANIFEDVPGGTSDLGLNIALGLSVLFIIALIALGFVATSRIIKRHWPQIRAWWIRHFGLEEAAGAMRAYVDEEENLFSWKRMREQAAARVRRLIRRVTTRPPRFSDMPDDRMRVRFAYKQLLKWMLAHGRGDATSRTPNELASDPSRVKGVVDESVSKLAAGYNLARYSPHDVTPDAVEAARSVAKRT